jgi:hypothetical protein
MIWFNWASSSSVRRSRTERTAGRFWASGIWGDHLEIGERCRGEFAGRQTNPASGDRLSLATFVFLLRDRLRGVVWGEKKRKIFFGCGLGDEKRRLLECNKRYRRDDTWLPR